MSAPIALLLLAFSGWFVAPTIALFTWIDNDDRPDGDAVEHRFLAALTIALGGVLLVQVLFARLGRIDARGTWFAVGVTVFFSIVATAAGLRRRHGLHIPRWGWATLGLLLLVGILTAIPALVAVVARPDSLSGSTPWYYWWLAKQAAVAGRIPSTSVEWGTVVPFLDDYPAFTGATAVLTNMMGRPELLHAAQLVRILSPALLGIGVYSLARSWGATRLAALAAVAGVASTQIFAIKTLSYRPEAFGYGLTFLVPAAAYRFLTHRDAWMLGAATLGFAALAQVHGIDWTFSAILVIATAAAFLLTGQRPTKRQIGSTLVLLSLLAVTWAGTNVVLNGRVSDAAKLQTAPTLSPDGTDPTWQFAAFGTGAADEPPPPPSVRAVTSLTKGFLVGPSGLLVVAVLLAVAAGVFARNHPVAPRLATLIMLVLLGTAILSSFFILGWDTFVPRRTGVGRLMQLTVALVPISAAAFSPMVSSPRLRRLMVGSTVILFGGLWVAALPTASHTARTQQPPEGTLAIERNLRLPNGIALANAYTEGFLPAMMHVDGLLDGRAPYTDAQLLERANLLLTMSSGFFGDPENAPFPFAAFGVRYVIVANRSWALGTSRIIRTNSKALRSDASLKPILDNADLTIYEVVGG